MRTALLLLTAAAAARAFVAPGCCSARTLRSSRAGICNLTALEKIGRRPSRELLEDKPVEADQRRQLRNVASGVYNDDIFAAELQRADRSGRGHPLLDIVAEQERVEQVARLQRRGLLEVNAKTQSNYDADAARCMRTALRKRAAGAARQGKSLPAAGRSQRANALDTTAELEQVYAYHYY